MNQLEQIKEWFATFLNYRENKPEPEPVQIVNKKRPMRKGLFAPYRVVNVLSVDIENGVVWQEGHFEPQPIFLFKEIQE